MARLSELQARYARLRALHPEWSNPQCAREAGYAEKAIRQQVYRLERNQRVIDEIKRCRGSADKSKHAVINFPTSPAVPTVYIPPEKVVGEVADATELLTIMSNIARDPGHRAQFQATKWMLDFRGVKSGEGREDSADQTELTLDQARRILELAAAS